MTTSTEDATAAPVAEGRGPNVFDGVLLAALVVAFSPAFLAMAEIWEVVDYQAHGYLVGPVAAVMAYTRRNELQAASGRGSTAGLWLLTGALFAYAFGLVGEILSVQGLAFPLAVAGLVWWRRGAPALRTVTFPIAYLVFMVPVPPQVMTPLVTRLQVWVTQTAMAVLQFFDVPALREGNVIVLPEGSLFVAEACSGITSIVTLMPVAALLVFLAPMARREAIVLMVSVAPVAMFWNLVRVLATVVATRRIGVVQATSGSLHETAGMLTFVAGCVTLLLISSRLGPAPPAEESVGK